MSLGNHMDRQKGYPFQLKRKTSEKPTSIYLRTYFEGKPFKYGIGKSIFPELWDSNSYRPIADRIIIKKYERVNPNIKIELSNIKTRIENVEREIKSYLNRIEGDRSTFDLTSLKQHLDEKIKKVVKIDVSEKSPFLLPYIEKTISGMEKGTVLIYSGKKSGHRYTHGTIKNYKGFQNQWKDFEKKIGKHVRFNDIDTNLYDELIQFFNKKGLAANTIGRHIRNLKVIMEMALQAGMHDLNPERTFRHKRFSAPEMETVEVYLTKEELAAMRKESFKDSPHYELYLDVFLIGCYTAQRYSDYSRITPNHLKERTIQKEDGTKRKIKVIELITKKTKDKVIIPVRPELEKLLSKYNYKVPRTHEQKLNIYIKEIADLAKIREPIDVEEIKGGVRIKKTIPKYKMLTTHSARRTGVTNMYLDGIPIEYIKKITGHQTDKSFRKYLRISKDEAATKMAQMDYFKGETGKIVEL